MMRVSRTLSSPVVASILFAVFPYAGATLLFFPAMALLVVGAGMLLSGLAQLGPAIFWPRRPRQDHMLQTSGMYRVLRHPICQCWLDCFVALFSQGCRSAALISPCFYTCCYSFRADGGLMLSSLGAAGLTNSATQAALTLMLFPILRSQVPKSHTPSSPLKRIVFPFFFSELILTRLLGMVQFNSFLF
jgi:hypothetical protein